MVYNFAFGWNGFDRTRRAVYATVRSNSGFRAWQITTELEIRDRPTISEDAMDVVSEIDLLSLEFLSSKLHILVHSSLPRKLN